MARWYIESEAFAASVAGPVRVVDGGSGGGSFAPFDALAAELELTGFEPDARPGEKAAVAKALWNSTGSVDLHRSRDKGVASVYPPDMAFLGAFPEQAATGRATVAVDRVDTTSIDEAVARGLCGPPDFIKLDVHSAEYEALEGAAGALGSAAGVLVETWHAPVHRGQRLHGDVERLLNARGFELFDHCPAAAWRYVLDGESAPADRPRLIASESLFFRDFAAARPASARDALVALALLDLYGYTSYAVRLCRLFGEDAPLDRRQAERAERDLLSLRQRREADAARHPNGEQSWRERVGEALRALRGRPRATQAHPLETGTQRLSQGPWT